MAKTLERPPVTNPPVRSSRSAWLALLASIVLFPVGLGLALANPAWGDAMLGVMVLLPLVAGVWLGIRSGQTGNRLGVLATAVGSALLIHLAVFFVGANSVWSGESVVAPTLLGIIAALVVAGAIELGWHRPTNTGHHAA